MDHNTILGMLAFAIGCFLVIFLMNLFEAKSSKFKNAFSKKGLEFLAKIEAMHENNLEAQWGVAILMYEKLVEPLPERTLEAYHKAIFKDTTKIEKEGTLEFIGHDYLSGLITNMNMRYSASFEPLPPINKESAYNQFNLNINNNEYIYLTVKNSDWFEEKSITESFSYSGYQYRVGVGNSSFRLGTLKVISNKSQKFIHIDRGTLFVTNKRLMFIGSEKRVNKTIELKDILEFTLYRDGVLIGKPNGKKPLISFPDYVIGKNEAPLKRDHLSRTIRVLDRLIQGTENSIIEFV